MKKIEKGYGEEEQMKGNIYEEIEKGNGEDEVM